MGSKTILVASILVLMLTPTATAQEDVETNPGITPDSPFYGLDVAMDRIRYRLSTNKTNTGLNIARERLSEIKKMREEGINGEKQEIAQRNAERMMERVKQRNRKAPNLDELERTTHLPEQAPMSSNPAKIAEKAAKRMKK